MDEQLPFSNETTSCDAAVTQARSKVQADERKVLDAVQDGYDRGMSGMTRDEIERATGLAMQTVTPRVDGLKRKGLLVEMELTRRTRRGRAAHVLRPARVAADMTSSKRKSQNAGRIVAALSRERAAIVARLESEASSADPRMSAAHLLRGVAEWIRVRAEKTEASAGGDS